MSKHNSLHDHEVVWLLGLPLDLVTLDDAARIVAHSAEAGRKLNLVTPNLSFLRQASFDSSFAKLISANDLSTIDGSPLLWLLRLLGSRAPHRVAGSDLFDRLGGQHYTRPLRVFFFGGPDGAAKQAQQRINETCRGITVVGGISPGFGDLDELSKQEFIDQINAATPDLVVLSVGTGKSLQWIDRNLSRLNCGAISYLGAVVNFWAGTVQRAPGSFSRFGLEWLWRTLQEPQLSNRYFRDAIFLAKTLFTKVIPIRIQAARDDLSEPFQVKLDTENDDFCTINISGSLTRTTVNDVYEILEDVETSHRLNLNMTGVKSIDIYGFGLIYCMRYRHGFDVDVQASPVVEKLAATHNAERLIRNTVSI